MFKEAKNVIIVGCGKFGAQVAEKMTLERKNIVIIDKNKEAFSKLSENFMGFTYEADAVEEEVLKKANIKKTDIVLTATEDDNANLMIAQIAKKIYEVPIVIARVFDPSREELYRSYGIETISPTTLLAERFSSILKSKEVK